MFSQRRRFLLLCFRVRFELLSYHSVRNFRDCLFIHTGNIYLTLVPRNVTCAQWTQWTQNPSAVLQTGYMYIHIFLAPTLLATDFGRLLQ